MTHIRTVAVALGLCLVLFVAGCSSDDSNTTGEHGASESAGEHDGGEGEHQGDSAEGEHDEEGEESGTQYTKAEAYDETRRGAPLLLSYAPDQDAFVGTVTNTTDDLLDQVRIEVHLSNGIELGPTTPGDIRPGESAGVTLSAEGEQFTTWSAHPEVGRDEHGDEEHGDG